MVLAAWKQDLYEERFRRRWGSGLDGECFWLLVNHVIDRITLPSSDVLVGCSKTEPGTPLCWTVVRKIERYGTYAVLHSYARHEIRKDPALAATLERELMTEVTKQRPIASERRPFNPFHELRH
jgi:hypothetical protein